MAGERGTDGTGSGARLAAGGNARATRRQAVLRLAGAGSATLVACGEGQRAEPAPGGSAPAAGATAPASGATTSQPGAVLSYSKQARVFNGNKITLSVWSWKDPFEPIFQKFFKQYSEMYPNVDFELTQIPFADFLKKVQAGIPARQAPDLFYLHWLWQPPVVDQKLLRPLPEDRFPQRTLEASYNYVKAAYSGVDNKAYWLPTGLLTFGLAVNNKLWAKAGLSEKDVPTTWDKVVELGQKLTERDSAGRITVSGFNPTGYIPAQWRTLHYQLGYWFFNQQNTRHLFDTPQMRQVLGFFDSLYKTHRISATDFLPWDQSFGNNQAAMIYMSMNVLPNIRKFEGLDFTVYRTPTWNGTLSPAATHGFLDPQSLVVPVSTPDDRAAVAFDLLHFLYSNKDFIVETALSQASFPLFKPALDDPRVRNDPVLKALEAQQERVVQTIGLPQSVSDIGTKYAYEAPFVAGLSIDQALKQGQAEMDEAMKLGGPAYVREREYRFAGKMKFPG